jgi:OFA family oxalate/formate antiporter-like MFS transporter
MNANSSNRRLIAVAGVLMQVALGAVYARSVFRIPLTQKLGMDGIAGHTGFELAILILGIAAFAAGLWMKRGGRAALLLSPGCAAAWGGCSRDRP